MTMHDDAASTWVIRFSKWLLPALEGTQGYEAAY
jgi:hypothetical protein